MFELVWFGYPGLHRFALVYFGLLCFGLIELGILHTMDHGQTRKKKTEWDIELLQLKKQKNTDGYIELLRN